MLPVAFVVGVFFNRFGSVTVITLTPGLILFLTITASVNTKGDGSMSKWTGTFKLDEKAGTLNMVAEMKGKKMPIDFKIVEKTNKKLSLKTSFGQIDMVYVYTKK